MWILERSPVQLNSDFPCSACASKPRKSTTNVHPFHFVKEGTCRHETSESEKNVALSFFFEIENTLLPFSTHLCGRIVLVAKFPLQICPQISEDKDYPHENQYAEAHLAMDPFFPDFSRGVVYLLRKKCTLCSSPKNCVHCGEVEDVVGALTPVGRAVAQVFHDLLVELLLLVAEVEERGEEEGQEESWEVESGEDQSEERTLTWMAMMMVVSGVRTRLELEPM